MDESGLTDVPEHGGGVEWGESEGLGTDAGVDGVGVSVCGDSVVVLEDGPYFGDAPGCGAEAGAARVGVGEAVDASPGILGFVVGLAMGGAGLDAEARVVVEPAAEGVDDEVVTVVLAGNFGSEVALGVMNLPPGALEATQVECWSRWAQSVSVSLREEGYTAA